MSSTRDYHCYQPQQPGHSTVYLDPEWDECLANYDQVKKQLLIKNVSAVISQLQPSKDTGAQYIVRVTKHFDAFKVWLICPSTSSLPFITCLIASSVIFDNTTQRLGSLTHVRDLTAALNTKMIKKIESGSVHVAEELAPVRALLNKIKNYIKSTHEALGNLQNFRFEVNVTMNVLRLADEQLDFLKSKFKTLAELYRQIQAVLQTLVKITDDTLDETLIDPIKERFEIQKDFINNFIEQMQKEMLEVHFFLQRLLEERKSQERQIGKIYLYLRNFLLNNTAFLSRRVKYLKTPGHGIRVGGRSIGQMHAPHHFANMIAVAKAHVKEEEHSLRSDMLDYGRKMAELLQAYQDTYRAETSGVFTFFKKKWRKAARSPKTTAYYRIFDEMIADKNIIFNRQRMEDFFEDLISLESRYKSKLFTASSIELPTIAGSVRPGSVASFSDDEEEKKGCLFSKCLL